MRISSILPNLLAAALLTAQTGRGAMLASGNVFPIFAGPDILVGLNDSASGVILRQYANSPLPDWVNLLSAAAQQASLIKPTDTLFAGPADHRPYPLALEPIPANLIGNVTTPPDETYEIFSFLSNDSTTQITINTFQNATVTFDIVQQALHALLTVATSKGSDVAELNNTAIDFNIFDAAVGLDKPIAIGAIAAPRPGEPDPGFAAAAAGQQEVKCFTSPDCAAPGHAALLATLVSQVDTVDPLVGGTASTSEYYDAQGKVHGASLVFNCTDFGAGIPGIDVVNGAKLIQEFGCSPCGTAKIWNTTCTLTLGDCSVCASIDGGA